jgi:hypothetical protein
VGKMFTLVALVAFVVPATALAAASPSAASQAQATCKQLQTSMGTSFAQTYGTNAARSNAFGQCVAKHASTAKAHVTNAAKTCKAEQADPNFAAGHDGKTFVQFYAGTKTKGQAAENAAYGKCVSGHARQASSALAKALTTAARSCKAELKADAASFRQTYGSARNAFGKCVAAKAKAK